MRLNRSPYVTLAICLIVTFVHYISSLQALLIYDRKAIFAGEYWRVLTAFFAHYSGEHLVWNLLVLGCFGSLLELRRRAFVILLLLITALGHALFLLNPRIEFFAGMSGYVTALVFYLCIEKMTSGQHHKSIWTLLLIVMVIKTVYELISPEALFAKGNFLPLPQAHIQGMIGALLVLGYSYYLKRGSPIAQ